MQLDIGRMEMGQGRQRARVAIWLLGANALLSAAQIVAYQVHEGLLMEGNNDPIRARSADDLVQGLGLAQLALIVVTAVVFLRWLHRAHENARALGRPSRLKRSARSAIWAFFIPIIHLRRPITVLTELQQASDPSDLPPIDDRKPNPAATYRTPGEIRSSRRALPAFFPVTAWWAFWVVAGVLQRLATYKALQLSEACLIASAVLGIFVVREIDRLQTERYARRKARGRRAP